MGALVVLAVFWGMSGLIGWAIGQSKGRGGEGLALGLFLGVIGWIIVAVMRGTPEAEARRQLEVKRAMDRLEGKTPPRPVVHPRPPIVNHTPPEGWGPPPGVERTNRPG